MHFARARERASILQSNVSCEHASSRLFFRVYSGAARATRISLIFRSPEGQDRRAGDSLRPEDRGSLRLVLTTKLPFCQRANFSFMARHRLSSSPSSGKLFSRAQPVDFFIYYRGPPTFSRAQFRCRNAKSFMLFSR